MTETIVETSQRTRPRRARRRHPRVQGHPLRRRHRRRQPLPPATAARAVDRGARRARVRPVVPAAGVDDPSGWTGESHEAEDCLVLNVWTPGLDRAGAAARCWSGSTAAASPSARARWPLYDGAEPGPPRRRRGGHRQPPARRPRLPAPRRAHGRRARDVGQRRHARHRRRARVGARQHRRLRRRPRQRHDLRRVRRRRQGRATLLAMPAADGLFHRAVVQSGPSGRVLARRARHRVRLEAPRRARPGDRGRPRRPPGPARRARSSPPRTRAVAVRRRRPHRGSRPVLDGAAITRAPRRSARATGRAPTCRC